MMPWREISGILCHATRSDVELVLRAVTDAGDKVGAKENKQIEFNG